MAVASTWLLGAVYLEAANLEVNGVNKVVPAGYYYLRHTFAALSLVDVLEALVQEEAAGATWYVTQSRHVQLQPQAAQPVAIDWLSSTELRDLLGYTGTRASSDAAWLAPNESPLLWSPGWLATPATPLGTEGYVTDDASEFVSADGTRALANIYAEQVWQDLSWTEIESDRMQVDAATDDGGTFFALHQQVLKWKGKVFVHLEQLEQEGDATAVTWDDSAVNRFGPYVLREGFDPRWYRRVIENADAYCPLDLPLMRVSEYS